jgi:hypothetical protein
MYIIPLVMLRTIASPDLPPHALPLLPSPRIHFPPLLPLPPPSLPRSHACLFLKGNCAFAAPFYHAPRLLYLIFHSPPIFTPVPTCALPCFLPLSCLSPQPSRCPSLTSHPCPAKQSAPTV